MDEIKKLPSFIQILVAQKPNEGVGKNNKPYKFQNADCVMLDEDGVMLQVGVMRVPNDLIDKVKPGVYQPGFGIRVDFQSREIKPVLMSLTPVRQQAPAAAAKA